MITDNALNPHPALVLKVKHFFLLFLAALSFHLIGSWSLPLIDRDEPRFSEASREMLERDNFIVPYFNNQYRFDKPPLTYWLQSTAYRFLGENELAARLPSVVAAAGLAVLLLAWGTRLRDVALGWRAAIIFSLSLQVVVTAKAAVADMPMVFFVALAAWCGWEILREDVKKSTGTHWWWLFFSALVFGFLAKGPIAWLPLIPVGIGLMQKSGIKHWFWFTIGIILTIGLVALWGIPALQQTGGEYFKIGIGKHVVGRSVSSMEGHGMRGIPGYLALLPFYFLTVFVSLFPWSWFLPALYRERKSIGKNSDQRYLAFLVLLYFVVFSLVKTKLPHYTLPAFPMLALLVAPLATTAQVRKTGTIMAVFLIAIFLIAFPLFARFFPSPALAEISRAYLKPEMEFASTGYVEGSLVWSFRKTVNGFYSKVEPKKAARWMQKKGPRFYILPTGKFSEAFPTPDPSWKILRHHGFNIAKAQKTDLTMVIKTQ